MSLPLILNLAIALAVCALLYVMQQRHVSFTKRVFTGLGLGVLLGAGASRRLRLGSPVIAQTNAWLDVSAAATSSCCR
jgi:L-cystine uptake protein TcyP (sodium:dicarboxylate symporter family)